MTKLSFNLSNTIVAELKDYTQILTLSPDIPKPVKRFIGQVLYGLLKNRSVMLSRIALALDEEQKLLYTEQRLSYHITNRRWDPMSAHSLYMNFAAGRISETTVLSLDMGDIAKPKARAMPGLALIWDGSRHEVAKGYPLVEIEAIGADGKHLPLYMELISTRKSSYVSQNYQIDMAVNLAVSHIGTKGVWVMDRGFDDEKRFSFFDELKCKWVIRARGDRRVERAGQPHLKARAISDWAKHLNPAFNFSVQSGGRTKCFKGDFMPVCLPGKADTVYTLVVVWGSGKKPWYLMTSLPVESFKDFMFVAMAYIRRWGVEDAARVIKQSFDLENIRLLTFDGLRKMVWLTLWAYGFVCALGLWPGKRVGALMSLAPTLWNWRDLKIIHYRLAHAVSEILILRPPPYRSENYIFEKEIISA